MKTCRACRITKSLEDFYTSKSAGAHGYQSRCKDCCKKSASEWAKNNRARINDRRRKPARKLLTPERRLENKRAYAVAQYARDRETLKVRVAAWKATNAAQVRAMNAARKATKLRATPTWANKRYIALWYRIAKDEEERLGVKCHVDHIVPLIHPLVCGLHTEDNLQVLTASENSSKQNRYWRGMPDGLNGYAERLALWEKAQGVLA